MAETMTFEEFRVSLAELWSAIGTVRTQAGLINTAMATVLTKFDAINAAWDGPASDSFDHLRTWFTTVQTQLSGLLTEMSSRMETAYWTYHDIEEANANNAT